MTIIVVLEQWWRICRHISR